MQNIPVLMSGYELMITLPPETKMRETEKDGKKTGEYAPVTNKKGEVQFTVSVLARQVSTPGQPARKGEELKVSLTVDPGEGFVPGSLVELVNPVINSYSFKNDAGETVSGISWRADGLTPVVRSQQAA